MSLLSVKQFSELCGDKAKSIETWIARGKVNVNRETGKKLVDTENPVNALFIQQRQDAHAYKKLLGELVMPVRIEKTFNKMRAEMKPAEAQRMNEQTLRAAVRIEQETKIRQQNIDLTELRIQSEKIRLDKTAGNLLPIDLAMGVIERHANSILKTFEKGFERIADIYANFAGMDPTTRTNFIKECRAELSHCVETAGKSAEAEIDILVDNYAETLMVGQKKA